MPGAPVGNTWGFKPGHNLSVGNRGRQAPSLITQELIALLNEVDRDTSKAKKWKLAQKLYDLAVGYDYTAEKVLDDGSKVNYTVRVQPDVVAIREIFDRAEGKPKQALAVTGEDGGPVQFEDVTVMREKLGKLLELKVVREEGADTSGDAAAGAEPASGVSEGLDDSSTPGAAGAGG